MVTNQSNGAEVMEDDEPVNIITDSGADATILPSDYLGVGVEADEDEPALQDPKKPQ